MYTLPFIISILYHFIYYFSIFLGNFLIKFGNYFIDITQNTSRGVSLDKSILAYFTDDLNAQSVAMALSQKEGIKNVKIDGTKSNIFLTNYTLFSLLTGAVIGIFLFNIASLFLLNGSNLTLEGALTGAVIGAITGAFSDIFIREEYDSVSIVSMHADTDNIKSALKQLKKRGPIQLYLEKK